MATISFQQFRDTYNGKGVDTDGAYGNQCMDLMHKYIVDVLGLSLSVLAAPSAYQAYQNGDTNFTKIANTPTGVPQNGDIVFWNTTVGSAGHVAVFVDGDVNSFNSFDQNWPVGSLCHVQNHPNYNGVAGWLRFKAPVAVDTLDSLRKQRDDNWNSFQAEVVKYKDLNAQFLQQNNMLDKANKKLSDIKTIIG
jgi:hypothetical protein